MSAHKNNGITCEVTVISPSERFTTSSGPIGLIYDINVHSRIVRAALGWGNHENVFDTIYNKYQIEDECRNYRAALHDDSDPDAGSHMAFLRSGRAKDDGELFAYGLCGINWFGGCNDRIAMAARQAMKALVILNMDFDELPEGESVVQFSTKELQGAPDQYIDSTL